MAKCDKCLWYEQCAADEACEHFAPIEEDDYLDETIEENRYEFYKEWFAYVDQSDE